MGWRAEREVVGGGGTPRYNQRPSIQGLILALMVFGKTVINRAIELEKN